MGDKLWLFHISHLIQNNNYNCGGISLDEVQECGGALVSRIYKNYTFYTKIHYEMECKYKNRKILVKMIYII